MWVRLERGRHTKAIRNIRAQHSGGPCSCIAGASHGFDHPAVVPAVGITEGEDRDAYDLLELLLATPDLEFEIVRIQFIEKPVRNAMGTDLEAGAR
jgi:hypothetical protein